MKIILIFFLSLGLVSCGSKVNDADGPVSNETSQQIGDVMASVDEAGGSTGNIAFQEQAIRKTFARYAPDELKENSFAKLFLPQAEAVSCNGFGFANCTAASITRNFQGCTVGSAVFTGTVVTTWTGTGVGSTCTANTIGNVITRSPSFSVEGRRGATLSVTKSGTNGQQLTVTALSPKTYNYTNDGIRRKFTTGVGTVLIDYTTTLSSPVTITGNLRSGRIMNGGGIVVTDNISLVSCTYAPVNVTWAVGTCNCPTQGTWQGTCTDGKSSSFVLTGCGTGTYSMGTETSNVVLDRCGT